jgi:hypothetical protein
LTLGRETESMHNMSNSSPLSGQPSRSPCVEESDDNIGSLSSLPPVRGLRTLQDQWRKNRKT